MDHSALNLLEKEIVSTLSYPLINIDEVNETIQFIETELISLYFNEKNIVDGFKYFKNILEELKVYDNRYTVKDTEINDKEIDKKKDQLQDIVLIADKYLCITDNNINILKSNFIIMKCLVKTIIHLLWQRLYILEYKKSLTLDTLEKASILYKNMVGDIIIGLKKCEIVNI
jgi:hypothetical protein